MGAAARIGVGSLAIVTPTAIYGLLIPIGLSETLAITSGLAIGPVEGFLVGALTIIASDLYLAPGPWTPFIAGIIGLLGASGGLLRGRVFPSKVSLAVVAVVLTLFSEFLQNLWVAWFYSVPLTGVLIAGLPTLFSALINNFLLLTLAGPRIIEVLDKRVNLPYVGGAEIG